MSRARFKVLAGVFGLSVCGLAALAQPPVCVPPISRAGGVPCQLAPVIEVQATAPSGPVATPPAITTGGTVELVAAPLPNLDPPASVAPSLTFNSTPTPPPPSPAPVVNLPLPGPNSYPPPNTGVQTPTATVPARLDPVPVIPALTQPVPPLSQSVSKPTSPPAPTSGFGEESIAQFTDRASTHSAALQVCLKLGDGPPKFEVCRGDDVLLKVVCTGVDVKAPSEKGEPFSVLRASGTVRFTAPGCEGTCEALVVHPVTGDVILTKGVEVKCKLGKGSTVMKAEQMTFKLGTAPAFAVTEVNVPGPGSITTTSGHR